MCKERFGNAKKALIAAVAKLYGEQEFSLKDMPDITAVRTELTRKTDYADLHRVCRVRTKIR